MNKKFLLLSALLILPLTSCSNKEISIKQAKLVYKEIEAYIQSNNDDILNKTYEYYYYSKSERENATSTTKYRYKRNGNNIYIHDRIKNKGMAGNKNEKKYIFQHEDKYYIYDEILDTKQELNKNTFIYNTKNNDILYYNKQYLSKINNTFDYDGKYTKYYSSGSGNLLVKHTPLKYNPDGSLTHEIPWSIEFNNYLFESYKQKKTLGIKIKLTMEYDTDFMVPEKILNAEITTPTKGDVIYEDLSNDLDIPGLLD